MIKRIFTSFFEFLLLVLVIIISAFCIRLTWVSYYKTAYPRHYENFVFEQSVSTGVPHELLFAVIRTESGFDPSAQSSVGARGLMQITRDTFEWARYRLSEEQDFDYDDLFDESVNIRYGAEILRLLMLEFESENNALCAYHAGWGNAQKWLKNPDYTENSEIINIPFNDTGRYVKKVLATSEIYRRLYN